MRQGARGQKQREPPHATELKNVGIVGKDTHTTHKKTRERSNVNIYGESGRKLLHLKLHICGRWK